jgi:hypothetical protein
MPCRNWEPGEEEYYNRIQSDSEFAKSEQIRLDVFFKAQDELSKQRKKERKKEFNDELKNKNLENIAFNSFMSVFLCRAMEIVVSNFDYKFVNSDLEWWFKEHQRRDLNHDESELTAEELAEKLIEFKKKYTVE